MKSLYLVLGAAILSVACGKDEKNLVGGYDADGNFVRERKLAKGDACPMDISEFEQSCIDEGHEVIYLHDCTTLCSGKVDGESE